MSQLTRAETCSADEIYFPSGYILLRDCDDEACVYIDLGRYGDDAVWVDGGGEAMRLANLFLAAEEMLQLLKDINTDAWVVNRRNGHRMRELIARAEGKAE